MGTSARKYALLYQNSPFGLSLRRRDIERLREESILAEISNPKAITLHFYKVCHSAASSRNQKRRWPVIVA
jgi:CRISPR/Cas system-associated endoribonuclease Cas2